MKFKPRRLTHIETKVCEEALKRVAKYLKERRKVQ